MARATARLNKTQRRHAQELDRKAQRRSIGRAGSSVAHSFRRVKLQTGYFDPLLGTPGWNPWLGQQAIRGCYFFLAPGRRAGGLFSSCFSLVIANWLGGVR